MQVIQLKRRIPGTGAPASGTGAGQVTAGEPAVSISAVGAAGVANMYIGDGSFVHPLVSAERQVELTGAQTITGAKTIGAAGSIIVPVANIHIGGGTDGDVLSTNGSGALEWIELPKGVQSGTAAPTPAEVGDLWYNTTTYQLMIFNGTAWEAVAGVIIQAAAPTGQPEGALWLNSTTNVLSVYNGTTWIASTGNRSTFGASAHANAVAGDIWWSPTGPQFYNGTAWTAATLPGFAGIATVDPMTGNGTTATPLGLDFADTGDINTGTDTTFPINSAGLRTQLGAAVSTLTTTAQTIVPAINELRTEISALSGAIRLVGTYAVPTDTVTPAAGAPITAGALPAAAATNEGWYVIVTTAGTGTGNAPHIPLAAGDWLVSTGSGGAWVHIPTNLSTFAASNVTISALDSQPWTNVQVALQGLFTRSITAGNTAVLADHVSVLGDGTSAAATATTGSLRVGTLDGGVY